MGPRSFERGNPVEMFHANSGRRTSMGPRSFERGNAVYPSVESTPETLQWGRARSSAETGSKVVGWADRHDFNGAALVRARKHPLFQPAHAIRSFTSMGPRSFERGNLNRFVSMRLRGYWTSMGPRSFERGNPLLATPHCSPVGMTSMGPRSFERGNSATPSLPP